MIFSRAELARGFRSETEHGAIQTNRWGMRDRDYSDLPPSGTVRGVLLEYSTIFGWGVGQEETFEAVLERRINDRLTAMSAGKFELLNVSVPGYRPPQQVMALDESLKFAPHLVFYTAADRELVERRSTSWRTSSRRTYRNSLSGAVRADKGRGRRAWHGSDHDSEASEIA